MAPMLTPEDVVRRIAAECTFVDERRNHLSNRANSLLYVR